MESGDATSYNYVIEVKDDSVDCESYGRNEEINPNGKSCSVSYSYSGNEDSACVISWDTDYSVASTLPIGGGDSIEKITSTMKNAVAN